MYSIPEEIHEHVENEFKTIISEIFRKEITKESIESLKIKIGILELEMGFHEKNFSMKVFVDVSNSMAFMFLEDKNEHF